MDKAITKSSLKNKSDLVLKMARYNLKIIFAGRFVWFVVAALFFFISLSFQLAYNKASFDSSDIYNRLFVPGILLIFYPTVFGIQNDADSRILEILFGIPDYRYKVWLIRLCMIFLLTWAILYLFSWIGYLTIVQFPVFNMSFQLMFPVLFLGSLAFLVSTIVKNGNGTAVVMILLGVVLMMMTNFTANTQWDVFLNPYSIPQKMNEMIWEQISQKNRLFLSLGSLVFLLGGLTNLQKRESFLK
ncbi:MAG TPA: hypothetical protein VIK10_13175 [Prolixibacteraceae bacterium]